MKKLLALTLCCTMFATGCSATWLSSLSGYLQIAGPILIQILDIVSLAKGQAPPAALEAKITADQAAVTSLANSVSTAATADLPTTCAAFNTAVSTFKSDLTAIEQLANIGSTTSGEIASAVGIAEAAITEIEAPLKACQGAPSPAVARAQLQLAAITVTSPNDVLRRFNAVVDKNHQVHMHNRLVRWMTLERWQ